MEVIDLKSRRAKAVRTCHKVDDTIDLIRSVVGRKYVVYVLYGGTLSNIIYVVKDREGLHLEINCGDYIVKRKGGHPIALNNEQIEAIYGLDLKGEK